MKALTWVLHCDCDQLGILSRVLYKLKLEAIEGSSGWGHLKFTGAQACDITRHFACEGEQHPWNTSLLQTNLLIYLHDVHMESCCAIAIMKNEKFLVHFNFYVVNRASSLAVRSILC
jgi:hypothetical protein